LGLLSTIFVSSSEDSIHMRWKLLIITSLLAALIGALPLLLGFHFGIFGSFPTTWSVLLINLNPRVLLSLLLPIAAITYATVFVYRHTARRRVLQASITALLAVLLTSAALNFGVMFLSNFSSPKAASNQTLHIIVLLKGSTL